MTPLDDNLASRSRAFAQAEARRDREWLDQLSALHASLEPPESRSKWSVEWAIHRWASETLDSAAIRIGKSEGLSGPAPAHWRILVHLAESNGPALALALSILDGRASLEPDNVVAALVDDGSGRAILGVRGFGQLRTPAKIVPNPSIAAELDALSDPSLARTEIEHPDALAFALALLRTEVRASRAAG